MKLLEKADQFLKSFEDDINDLEDGTITLKKYIPQLGSMGLLGLASKRNVNNTDFSELAELHFNFGSCYMSLQNLLTVTDMVLGILDNCGDDSVNQKYSKEVLTGNKIGAFALTEPNVGSDVSNIETELSIDSNKSTYTLNGKKKWITLGAIADFFIIFTKFENNHAIVIMDSEQDGIEVKAISNQLGLRANALAEIHFNNVEVRQDQILVQNSIQFFKNAMHSLNLGRFTTACGAVGLLQRCYDESVKYSKTRNIGNAKLHSYQLIKQMITEIYVDLEASKLLCLEAAKELNDKPSKALLPILSAKYFSTKSGQKASSHAIQIQGANGVAKESVVQRLYRDSKILELIEGTTQIHEVLIAKELVKRR